MRDDEANSPGERPASFDNDGPDAPRAEGAEDANDTATSGGDSLPPPSLTRLGDFELLRELGRPRAMMEDRTDFDSSELPRTATSVPDADDAVDRIGPYRLLQRIGEGGMGEVWLAQQSDPVRRLVAVKVIKQGMDTKQVVARFEAERQALAMMNHRAVAKVFDAGATPEGRPYFAMEYVHGVPITTHCDLHRLSTAERLRLFMQVCEGVQHAHQKAIIHRDLKPSNVLVAVEDGKQVPTIIDFGVAKATAQRLTEKTIHTRLGALIGTPDYMSPEQADLTGQDVDTRTDVYSLGVMLYELLVGALPFEPEELRRGGYEGIRRMIREEDPPRPSTRLSTLGARSKELARLRRVDVPGLRRQLRGDLDWVTMKTLEKDRARRYGSPMELAADLERHLKHEPVAAGPPNVAYRTRKFVRRHRFGVGAAAAGLVLLVGFAVESRIHARRLAVERDRAESERETAERVSEFLANTLGDVQPGELGRALWSDLRRRVEAERRSRGESPEEAQASVRSLNRELAGVNPTDVARSLVAQEILERAAGLIERDLGADPRIAGRLEYTLAETFDRLGAYELADAHARRAEEIRTAALGVDHPDTLRTRTLRAWLKVNRGGELEANEQILRETLEAQRRVLGDEHPDVLATRFRLGVCLGRQGKRDQAEPLYREAATISARVLGDTDPATLLYQNALASLYVRSGRYDEAVAQYLATLAAVERTQDNDHRVHRIVLANLGALYGDLGRFDEAEAMEKRAIELNERVDGAEHPNTLTAKGNLAVTYQDWKRYAEAERLFLEVIEGRRRALGEGQPDTLSPMDGLASVYRLQGRNAEAERLYREVIEGRRRALGEGHPDTLSSMSGLALTMGASGRRKEAEKLRREILEINLRVRGPDDRETLSAMNSLAWCLAYQGRIAEAEKIQRNIIEVATRALGSDDSRTLWSFYSMGCLAAMRADRDAAIEWLTRAVDEGFANAKDMRTSSDLVSLRGDAAFEQLVRRASENAAREAEE